MWVLLRCFFPKRLDDSPMSRETQESTEGPESVVIAVLTYLRPDGLDAILTALIDQARSVPNPVTVLVVDNDPAGSAMARADEFDASLVRFVHETTPGIAAARNAALRSAADERLLVFIDDDERPQDGWLKNLIECWTRYRSAAVAGPVISSFTGEPDPWIIAGRFFVRRRLATGCTTSVAGTGNILLDLDFVRLHDVRFDERFSHTGGSDSLFTMQITRAGGKIVWCDEAVAVDVVPPERMNRKWVLRRRLRIGIVFSRVAVVCERSWFRRTWLRFTLSVGGLVRLIAGSARVGFGIVTGSLAHRANGARIAARGTGIALGAWGFSFSDYKRSVGP